MQQAKQLYILPGYNSSPDSHWFAWLEQEMQRNGFATKTIGFPNPAQPKVAAWLDCLAANIASIDENTFFVAHSLGAVTLLRYLQQVARPHQIGGYILVAGFYWQMVNIRAVPAFANIEVTTEQDLADFSNFSLDCAYLTALTNNRLVIAAKDDYILPYQLNLSQDLANSLSAQFYPVEIGGHFLAGDGFETFPLLAQSLRDWSAPINSLTS